MNRNLLPLGSFLLPVCSAVPKVEFGDTNFTYLDIGSVDRELKAITAPQVLSTKDAPSRARQIVCRNDILVSTVRPNLNTVAIIEKEYKSTIASTGYCVLRTDPKRLDCRYLFHWISCEKTVKKLVALATGASYPAVSDKIIKSLLIEPPSLEEQKRIAAVFDKADSLRCKRQQAILLADDFLRAAFIDMFGDPVTNPKGWRDDLVLADVAEVASGITKGRKLPSAKVREVPYLAVANVQDRHLKLDAVKTIEASEDEIARYRLRRDDLLLTEGGDPDKLGRGTLWRDELRECIHQNHIFRVRLNSGEVSPIFLNWLIGSKRGKQYFLNSAKQTTGIASINMRQLKAFPLLVPPRALQERFSALVLQATTLLVRHKKSLAAMESLPATLACFP